ncbi:MAG TPA: glucose 1-dehydrogenase [Desulfobacteraceae bacterium]|mgnify:CR=1 FL=1|nr:glucose 1-dehydrogenase [Desulfobacteraceae bacterium]
MSESCWDLPSWELHGKAAVVTGAGQGIGKWIATGLAAAGADVCVADINADTAEETSREIERMGHKSTFVKVDAGDIESVNQLMESAVDSFGRLDIVVNNAGVNVHKPAVEVSGDDFDFVVRVNSKGVYFCCQAAARIMIPSGKGKIINTASAAGFLVRSGVPNSVYAMTKGGIVMLTKAFAEEWSGYNINVNAVAPGYMATPLVADRLKDPKVYQSIIESTPLKRVGQANDLIGAFVFLASDASDFITGQTICVDGGRTIL